MLSQVIKLPKWYLESTWLQINLSISPSSVTSLNNPKKTTFQILFVVNELLFSNNQIKEIERKRCFFSKLMFFDLAGDNNGDSYLEKMKIKWKTEADTGSQVDKETRQQLTGAMMRSFENKN